MENSLMAKLWNRMRLEKMSESQLKQSIELLNVKIQRVLNRGNYGHASDLHSQKIKLVHELENRKPVWRIA